ncbi:MAG TPA: YIP1 family protein, partial [Bacteroidales bacterium]|nr:YIP1 family protein [Bacteroidales bacterium]
FNPAKAWESISSENRPLKDTRNSFLLPLAALVAVSAMAGSFLLANKQFSIIYSLLEGLKYFILLVAMAYSSAVILKQMTYALDLGRDFSVAFKLIAYSLTPLYVCLVVSNLFESMVFIDILALYGLFIFWEGVIKMINPPEHKKMPLLIATAITIIGLYVVFSIVLNQVFDHVYNAFFA